MVNVSFQTPAMRALGIPAVTCTLNEAGYPSVAVQEQIAALIGQAEAEANPVDVPCANPRCSNRFTPWRRDQVTCGTARCRKWLSRQANVTVPRRPGKGTGDPGLRRRSPAIPGAVTGNCDSPRLSGGRA